MLAKEIAPRRSAVCFTEAVSAATNDFPPDWIRRRSLRIDHGSARQISQPVLAPFPHISFHVIQSPWIRKFLANRVNSEFTVQEVPRMIRQARVIKVIAVAEPRRRPSPRRPFPLRFCGKTINAGGGNSSRRAFPLSEPGAIIRRVLP